MQKKNYAMIAVDQVGRVDIILLPIDLLAIALMKFTVSHATMSMV